MNTTPIYYVDVNKNLIKFKGEALVEVKTERNRVTLPILIREKGNTQLLLGLDWLDKLEIGLQGNRDTNIIRNKRNKKSHTVPEKKSKGGPL